DEPDPERAAGGDDLELDGPRAQVVEALLRDDAEQMPDRGAGVRLRELPGREVAAADVEHLAGPDELVHRLPELVEGRGAVDVVHLVEVDVVGAEAPEALVARAPDVVGGQPAVVRARPHAPVDLGGQHAALAPSA